MAQDAFSEYYLQKNEVLYSKSSRTINAIDPKVDSTKKGGYYPGNRGANQLVVYTRCYGDKTGTNEFGAEAIVKDNIVVALSGADSLIPEGGVVVSGHGNAKTWINKNLIIGTKVFIDRDNNSITAYTTSDSYIYGAKECLEEVEDVMDYYIKEYKNYDKKQIEHYIKSAESCIKKAETHPAQVKEYSELAIEYANKALFNTIPYKNELRGVWIRPACKNREEVAYQVSRLAEAGINNIFLETYYHGMTIFPSKTMVKYGFTEENPVYNKFDVLEAYVEECHKRNIKVNIWFETFYVGNKRPESSKTNILYVNPYWSNLTKRDYESEKPVQCAAEHNGYFLDPANPEVQTFLLKLACEIIYNYQPDGINMDYIRYPQASIPRAAGSELGAWGYTQYARNEFKSLYGVDPVSITPNDSYWQAWNDYRRGKITSFVRRLSKICRSNKVMLTAVIFPSKYSALENKHQDWEVWTSNDYVDGFTPLFLTCDAETASDMMKGVLRYKNPKTKLFAGLFVAFMNGSESDLIRQIHEVRKLKIDGFSIFDYAHLKNTYIAAMKESIAKAPPEQTSDKKKRRQRTKKQKQQTEKTTSKRQEDTPNVQEEQTSVQDTTNVTQNKKQKTRK